MSFPVMCPLRMAKLGKASTETGAQVRLSASGRVQPKLEVMSRITTPMAGTPTSASNKRHRFETGQFFFEFRSGRNLPEIAVSRHIRAIRQRAVHRRV